MIARLRGSLARFRQDTNGGMALLGALSLIPLVTAAFIAVDFSSWVAQKSKLQQTADGAAIASARELQMGQSDLTRLAAVAREFVLASLGNERSVGPASIKVKMIDARRLQIEVSQDVRSMMGKVGAEAFQTITVKSVARISSGLPLCVVVLDPSQPKSLHMDKRARLSAEGCAVYSNSQHQQGLRIDQDAVLVAGLICSGGGKFGNGANFKPQPLTDCPPISDPLSERKPPAIGTCVTAPAVIKGTMETLNPGTYCNGLTITDNAVVTFRPGIYIIKDGEFKVEGNAAIKGENVGFYFTGDKTALDFGRDSSISLTAPKDGPMAGILFFEDRAAPLGRRHKIKSSDANTLLGTIYLPRGSLFIDSEQAVAGRSAYTVILARKLELDEGPNLILNTNYGATDIPVPQGVGPTGKVALSQ